MTFRILILFTLISISIYGQDIDSNNCSPIVDTTKQLNETAKTIDSVCLEFNDSCTIVKPTDVSGVTKIILVKKKSKVDYLNYLFPILTLLLGIWVKELIDKRSYTKHIKKAGERWTTELRSLEEPLRKQVASLSSFLDKFIIEDFGTPEINRYASINGQIFKSLDKNELLKYIELRNKKLTFKEVVKISNKTQGHISIISSLYDTLEEKLKSYLFESSKHTENLTKHLQEFGIAFTDYRIFIESQTKEDAIKDSRYNPLAVLYRKQIIPHIEDGKFIPSVMKNDFYIPVLRILNNQSNKEEIKELFKASSSAMNSIKHIEMERIYISENIDNIKKSYEEELSLLDELVNNIERTKA